MSMPNPNETDPATMAERLVSESLAELSDPITRYYEALSVSQKAFLEARRSARSDVAACSQAKIAPGTLTSWKKRDHGFLACYNYARPGAETGIILAHTQRIAKIVGTCVDVIEDFLSTKDAPDSPAESSFKVAQARFAFDMLKAMKIPPLGGRPASPKTDAEIAQGTKHDEIRSLTIGVSHAAPSSAG
jgi:hypothetical protein